jgi:hypothetical protein
MKCPECGSTNVQLTQFIEDPPIDIPCKTEEFADELHCLDCMSVFAPEKDPEDKVWVKQSLRDHIPGNMSSEDALKRLLDTKLESLLPDDDD